MNLGTKRQWLRLALGMAALLFFVLCFIASRPLYLRLSHHSVSGEGIVLDKAVTAEGYTLAVRTKESGQPYLLLYCDEACYRQASAGDRLRFHGPVSPLTQSGHIQEFELKQEGLP